MRTKLILPALLALAPLLLCVACGKGGYKPQKPRAVTLSEVYITGEWKEFIEVVPGNYTLEDSGSFGIEPRITLRLKLKKSFDGEIDDPASTFRLVALSAAGSPVGAGSGEMRISTKEKFNEFVRGKPDDTVLITFNSTFWLSMNSGKNDFAAIAGFDGKTVEPPKEKPADKAADEPAPAVSQNTSPTGPRNTDTDPIFNPRTEARIGRRIVAVPEFTPSGSITEDMAMSITNAVTTGLTENTAINRIIDYSQINRIMVQQRFEASDWSNPAKYAEIGKALNVDTITVGTISMGGKTLFFQEMVVSVRLIDISTMAVAGAFTTQAIMSGLPEQVRTAAKTMKVTQ
ncbi:MAG: hypothetical protein LBS57_06150 [Treponema sp.]|nr:hypothetical protein [Treponema sp.]